MRSMIKKQSLGCLEEIVYGKVDVIGGSRKIAERRGEDSRGNFYHLRKCIYYHEQNVDSTMNMKNASVELAEGNKERAY